MKIILSGASGRVGQILDRMIGNMPTEAEVVARWGQKSPPADCPPADVCIDFSVPQALSQVADVLVRSQVPWVCGVTGFDTNQKNILIEASRSIPVLWSSNFSLGIALMRRALGSIAESIATEDVYLTEWHHEQKRDQPSGTAILLAEDLEAKGCQPKETHSIRTQDFSGTHVVDVHMAGESLRFEHMARSRKIFARGAMVAAHWLQDQKAGWYSFSDVVIK